MVILMAHRDIPSNLNLIHDPVTVELGIESIPGSLFATNQNTKYGKEPLKGNK